MNPNEDDPRAALAEVETVIIALRFCQTHDKGGTLDACAHGILSRACRRRAELLRRDAWLWWHSRLRDK